MRLPLFFCRFRVWGTYPIDPQKVLSGEVVSRKSDHRSRFRSCWKGVKSGMGSLVGFFSRLPQAHLLGPAGLFFFRKSVISQSAGDRLKAAPAQEAGAVFSETSGSACCYWCAVERNGQLPRVPTLRNCARHRTPQQQGGLFGL